MGFWPFGRGDANVESASRVVTASTKSGLRVRGKLTLHFEEPQTQGDADGAADECAVVAEALLRESDGHDALIGAEPEVSGRLLARYPATLPPVRGVELAALHVVGDQALSGQLRRASSGQMQAVKGPSPSSVPPAMPVVVHGSSSPPPVRRRASSQMRAINVGVLPYGATPVHAAAFLGPVAHDAASRLLIGFLRAHDLLSVRKVEVDAETAVMLIPVSEAAPGAYEASRADELGRWSGALGAGIVAALRREAHLIGAYVAQQSLLRSGVAAATAEEIVTAICASNLSDAEAHAELVRFPDQLPSAFTSDVVSSMRTIARAEEAQASMVAALEPLVQQIEADLLVGARAVKHAVG
ncbi:MAG TPA: hypothetical protein VGM56_05100 [Byssovorax sp.]|jgi:hypothetical protein